MKFDYEILDGLAVQILARHSFELTSFPSAKAEIFIHGDVPIEYTFDRLSLCVYSHNLDKESYSYLGKQLTEQYETTYSREEYKCRREYGVLFHFMEASPEYQNLNVTKKERPDFCLTKTQKIGVEITEFTTERDSVMTAISKQNFGQGKSATEIKQNAFARHGSKAGAYNYFDFGNVAGVDSGMFDVLVKKKTYASEVIKKYDLYQEMLPSFDEFIILCDAQYTICVNDKVDSAEVAEIVRKARPDACGFTLCILRESDHVPIADKYLF